MIKLGLIVEFVLYMYLADLIENKKKTPQDVSLRFELLFLVTTP